MLKAMENLDRNICTSLVSIWKQFIDFSFQSHQSRTENWSNMLQKMEHINTEHDLENFENLFHLSSLQPVEPPDFIFQGSGLWKDKVNLDVEAEYMSG